MFAASCDHLCAGVRLVQKIGARTGDVDRPENNRVPENFCHDETHRACGSGEGGGSGSECWLPPAVQ